MPTPLPELSAGAVLAACPAGPARGSHAAWLRATFELAEAVAPGPALATWATDLVLRELPERADAICDWVEWVEPAVWAALADQAGRAPVLAITAGRFLALTAPGRAYDLDQERPIAGYPADWFESRVFNLRTLAARCRAQAAKWTTPQPPSGPTPTPRPSS